MKTLGERMGLILVGTVGSGILILAGIFVDYKQSIFEAILPILLLVFLGLTLLTLLEFAYFLQEKTQVVK